MTPSKLLIAAYIVGGCIAGSMLESGKKPASAQVTYAIYAYLAILLIAAILMVRGSLKRGRQADRPDWWTVYGNPVTAGVCFVGGVLLITVGLF